MWVVKLVEEGEVGWMEMKIITERSLFVAPLGHRRRWRQQEGHPRAGLQGKMSLRFDHWGGRCQLCVRM